ncbi:hypothetical protein BOTU111922_10015 [Bordetella tumulicola]
MLQSLLSELTLACGMQLEELAPRMRHAADLDHALSKTGLIARVVVTE